MKKIFVFMALILAFSVLAETDNRGLTRIPVNGQRVALVMGNKDYPDNRLRNPINDARDMKTVLDKLGFVVVYRENASFEQMNEAMHEFIRKLDKDSVALFYFSGHGVQADKTNYLLPIGAMITNKTELKSRAYDASVALDRMEKTGARINMVFLDACRNVIFRGYGSPQNGWVQMGNKSGSIIAFATALDEVADDGTGRNGTFTKHLLRYIQEPGLTAIEALQKVQTAVADETHDLQKPWLNYGPLREFCFTGCPLDKKQPIAIEMVDILLLDIAIGKYEISKKQWQALMVNNNADSSEFEDSPITQVSFDNAQEFVRRLNQATGLNYRLPTSKEWQIACEAGQALNYCGSNDPDEVAWYADNSNGLVHPFSESKKPNAWGIFNMSGNVNEWTTDCYDDDCNRRVIRGGGSDSKLREITSVFSSFRLHHTQEPFIGFRVVMPK